MARYFEDDEVEDDQPRHDTEVTLSWGTLLGMALGLLVICVLCFGLGYMAGHSGRASVGPAATNTPATQSNAPEQEPLQGSGSLPKPSASAQAAAPAPPAASDDSPSGAHSDENAAPSGSNPQQSTAPPAAQAPTASPEQQVHPVLGSGGPVNSQVASSPNVRPALPSENSLMVQVAAVKNEEDATVLTNALRRRGYPVTAHRDAGDGLIHVRIGPFPTRDEANQWRIRLLNDGYNAIVQP
jgi:DedD protein